MCITKTLWDGTQTKHQRDKGQEICVKNDGGLPWWRSGWESACQCRGHGFAPWSGKIPHAAEQLSPWATTTEPARLEPVLCNKRGRDGERPAHRDEEWPPLAATGESAHTETKTQHSHKLKKKRMMGSWSNNIITNDPSRKEKCQWGHTRNSLFCSDVKQSRTKYRRRSISQSVPGRTDTCDNLRIVALYTP